MVVDTCAALAGLAGPERDRAWTFLVQTHGDAVWRMIGSRCADRHLAEDIHQEFWLRLPASATRFRPAAEGRERAARAWLLGVAYAITIDEIRRRRSASRRVAGDVGDQEAPMARDDHDREEQLARVQAALRALPERDRQPLLLHLVGELGYEELAVQLRCTVNSARVRVHRALQRLRAALGREGAGVPTTTLAGLLVPPGLGVPPAFAQPGIAGAGGASAGGGSAAAGGLAPVAGSGGGLLAIGAGVAGVALVGGAIAVSFITTPAVPESPMPILPTAATILAAGSLAAATVLDDFERAEPGLQGRGEGGVNGTVSIVPAPAGLGNGSALRFAWPEPHGRWVDCGYEKARPAPGFVAGAACEVRLSLWMEAHAGITYLAVRFRDAQGEIFEWRSPPPERPDQSGWRAIRIPLPAEAPAGHWSGTEPDGKVTFPVAFSGYAVRFADAEVPAGAVIIDEVALVSTEKE